MFKNWKRKTSALSPFDEQMARICTPMIAICFFALKSRREKRFPCRDFLTRLHTEATYIEELIDKYGAQKSKRWFPFREAVAASKLFSSVYYNMMHIKEAFPRYRLLDIEGDFSDDMEVVMKMLKKAIVSISETMIQQAKRCQACSLDFQPSFKSFSLHLSVYSECLCCIYKPLSNRTFS